MVIQNVWHLDSGLTEALCRFFRKTLAARTKGTWIYEGRAWCTTAQSLSILTSPHCVGPCEGILSSCPAGLLSFSRGFLTNMASSVASTWLVWLTSAVCGSQGKAFSCACPGPGPAQGRSWWCSAPRGNSMSRF